MSRTAHLCAGNIDQLNSRLAVIARSQNSLTTSSKDKAPKHNRPRLQSPIRRAVVLVLHAHTLLPTTLLEVRVWVRRPARRLRPDGRADEQSLRGPDRKSVV